MQYKKNARAITGIFVVAGVIILIWASLRFVFLNAGSANLVKFVDTSSNADINHESAQVFNILGVNLEPSGFEGVAIEQVEINPMPLLAAEIFVEDDYGQEQVQTFVYGFAPDLELITSYPAKLLKLKPMNIKYVGQKKVETVIAMAKDRIWAGGELLWQLPPSSPNQMEDVLFVDSDGYLLTRPRNVSFGGTTTIPKPLTLKLIKSWKQEYKITEFSLNYPNLKFVEALNNEISLQAEDKECLLFNLLSKQINIHSCPIPGSIKPNYADNTVQKQNLTLPPLTVFKAAIKYNKSTFMIASHPAGDKLYKLVDLVPNSYPSSYPDSDTISMQAVWEEQTPTVCLTDVKCDLEFKY